MIDIENKIFNEISSGIKLLYPSTFVTGEYIKAPPRFPCVSVIENDNYMLEKTQDSKSVENHVSVLYEVNVYSNKKNGKKTECKEIMSHIDRGFIKIGFTRVTLSPIPNMEDATVYRMVARYRAVVAKNEKIYRR